MKDGGIVPQAEWLGAVQAWKAAGLPVRGGGGGGCSSPGGANEDQLAGELTAWINEAPNK